jgi:hypothetical protein
MLIQLANGLLDGTDLFNYAEIDELRGKQQNYLVDKDLVIGNIGHVPKILEDLIVSLQTKEGLTWKGQIKDAVWKLYVGDIETILVKIRENTYGPRFYLEAQCPHCDTLNKNQRLDLDKLEIKFMSLEDLMKPKVVMLPKAQVEVELKPLFLKDLFDLIKIPANHKNTLMTSILSLSIKRLGTKDKITSKDVEDLYASDLNYLREQAETMTLEGNIDSELEITCSNCNKDFKSKMDMYDARFFDHTKGSTTSST